MATKPTADKTTKAKKTTTTTAKTTAKKATAPAADVPVRATTATAKTASKRSIRLAAKPPCRIAKCKRTYRAKGYCVSHYRLWRQNEYGNGRYKECGDTNCKKAQVRNRFGYCEDHFQSYYVKGQAVAKAPAAAAPAKEEKKKEAAA